MKKNLLLLCLFISCQVYSQDDFIENVNPRTSRPFGINFNIYGPSILGLSTDYYINSKTNLEVGVGLFGYFGGATYHFNGDKKTKKLTPYLGLYTHRFFDFEFDEETNKDDDVRTGIYIPFGIQYINEDGITFRIEIATGSIIPLWGALKFGYHF